MSLSNICITASNVVTLMGARPGFKCAVIYSTLTYLLYFAASEYNCLRQETMLEEAMSIVMCTLISPW